MTVAGEGDEIAWILEDDKCGQFAVVTEDEIHASVAKHFLFIHKRTGELLEGRDWRRIAPPMRCDMCGTTAELPWWEHIATPRLTEVDDRDGRWLVCDACHELVVRKNVEGLFRRAWARSVWASPWVTQGEATSFIQARLREMMKVAVERFDAGTRETL